MTAAAHNSEIFDELPVGFVVIEGTGTLRHANVRAAELFGTPREAFIGRPLTDLVEPDDCSVVCAWRARLVTKLGAQWCEVRARREGGQLIWLRLDGACGRGGSHDDAFCRVVLTDVTERKAVEAERDALAMHRQVALDAARMGWWRYDPVERYAWWDERYKQIFGVEGNERPNDEILARLHPEDLSGVWEKVEAALDPADPRPYAAEYRVRRPDGTVWVEAHGLATFEGEGAARRAVNLVGTVADITERKLAEQAVRDSEARYRVLFEEASEGIGVADAETGQLVDCNRAFEELTGYPRSELIGRSQRMLHPEDQTSSRVSQTFEAHQAAPGHALPDRLRTRSGEIRYVEIRSRIVHVGGRELMLGVFRDCSRERQSGWERDLTLGLLRLFHKSIGTQELLHEATELLQKAVACDAVGVRLREGDDYPYVETRGFPAEFVELERSLCVRGADGQVLRDSKGNPSLACMCGNILCGRVNPALSFFTRGGSFWSNWTSKLLATTTDEDRQARTRNRCNGAGYESVALIPVRHGGKILGLLQLNDHQQDRFDYEMISFLEVVAGQLGTALAQRAAQAALATNENQLRALNENIPGMVYSFRPDWSARVVSKCEELCEHPASDLLAGTVTWLEVVHPDDRAELLRETGALVQSRAPRSRRYRITTRSGQLRWAEDHASPRFGPGGTFEGVDGVVFDVTRERDLEAQLLQAQKMESIGRLAGGVAHDFNNLLMVIEHNTAFALEGLGPNDAARADLQEVSAAASRAAGLTKQLLAFSRKQVLEPRVLCLNEIVSGMAPMLGRLLGEDIQIELNAAADLGRVRADQGQIEQVLLNLAINARDAMPEGGKLTIGTANLEFDEHAAAQRLAANPGKYVMLAVADTGVGMTADVRARIFEPFFTTKGAGKGTGLGLSTVYGIVSQSGGKIRVSSEPGRGTTFNVFLPRSDAAFGESPPSAPPAHPKASETVLIVEDERAVRQVIERILSGAGYRVLVSCDAEEALSLFESHASEISLVLTDVVMPHLSGKQLVERLAPKDPGLRVLYMSGYTDDAVVHHGVLARSAAFLSKPFSSAGLLEKVREVLAG